MTALVGNERSSALLARFSQILESSFEQGHELQDERQLLLDQVRATVSAAGMLGFARLAETCRDLEAALKEDRELEKPLDKVRAAKLRSLRTLSQLQGDRPASRRRGRDAILQGKVWRSRNAQNLDVFRLGGPFAKGRDRGAYLLRRFRVL